MDSILEELEAKQIGLSNKSNSHEKSLDSTPDAVEDIPPDRKICKQQSFNKRYLQYSPLSVAMYTFSTPFFLYRVSFGSSKGSMVEMLIYDDSWPLDTQPIRLSDFIQESPDDEDDADCQQKPNTETHHHAVVTYKLNPSTLSSSFM
jgi:hypothetical protein